MKLVILVNRVDHLAHIVGLTRAATGKSHEVRIFAMDSGTRLLDDALFVDLADLPGVSMCACGHSMDREGIKGDGLPESVVRGSQLNYSMMNRDADRVIVL
ncbi:MAG: DsrE family protein [Rhodospirillales bacterium]|nr:DsrE family protein [Rhodospirillales bacterium]MDH3912569.1 DsrE family protein [Rhodospirillales bacterium]MDH3916949.1 DsrE family protein [Rhodospirillales bacterium]MDH3970425.1 DsrE family protein [Rhodospirillales bacterium]